MKNIIVLSLLSLFFYPIHAQQPDQEGPELTVKLSGKIIDKPAEWSPVVLLNEENDIIHMLFSGAASGSSADGMKINFRYDSKAAFTINTEAGEKKVYPMIGFLNEEGNLQVGGGPALYATPVTYSPVTGKITFDDGITHYLLYCGAPGIDNTIYKAYEIINIVYANYPYPEVGYVGNYQRLSDEELQGPWLFTYKQVLGDADDTPIAKQLFIQADNIRSYTNSIDIDYSLKWMGGVPPENAFPLTITAKDAEGNTLATSSATKMNNGLIIVDNLEYLKTYSMTLSANTSKTDEQLFESVPSFIECSTEVAKGLKLKLSPIAESVTSHSVALSYTIEPGNMADYKPMTIQIVCENGVKNIIKDIGTARQGTIEISGLYPNKEYTFKAQAVIRLGEGYTVSSASAILSVTTENGPVSENPVLTVNMDDPEVTCETAVITGTLEVSDSEAKEGEPIRIYYETKQ